MNQANITAEGCPVTEAELEAIARYSRRPLTAEEVYTFPLVLCDNDLDRDHECFTDAALEKLAVLFRGKTGIFDHDPRGEKQTARIYRCAVEEEPGRLNHRGEPYKALKAWAYMVRTAANADLILEIDGGIKKEVSVGCSIGKKVCSICGADRQEATCGHQPGKKYGGRLCYTLLEDPTDAYEWSFVAVPAQKNAGVTRKFYSESNNTQSNFDHETAQKLFENLKKDVTRLCFLCGENGDILKSAADRMNVRELLDFKSELEYKNRSNKNPQLAYESSKDFTESFKMTKGK